MNQDQRNAIMRRLVWNGCTDLDEEFLSALIDRAERAMLLSDDPSVHPEQVYDAIVGFCQDAVCGDPQTPT